MCSCCGIETTIHFFLHCASFNTPRQTLFDKIATIDANNLTENEDNIVKLILSYLENEIVKIPSIKLNASIEFILLTARFNNHYSNAK